MSYFNYFSSSANNEWDIVNDNTKEFIEQYGIPIKYLPRTAVAEDSLFGEDGLSTFDEVIDMKMYLEDTTTFGGQGDIFSQFGLEVNDTIKLKIQQNHITEMLSGELPEIGDLIQFAFNKDIFEITFVEDEEMFYISGRQTTYTLSAKRFEYSGEILETGDDDIDDLDGETTSQADDSIQTFTDSLDFTETNPFGEDF